MWFLPSTGGRVERLDWSGFRVRVGGSASAHHLFLVLPHLLATSGCGLPAAVGLEYPAAGGGIECGVEDLVELTGEDADP